mgnify:CR=1 FL=1
MNTYKNQSEVTLMTWEENPNKRNENNIITVNLKSTLPLCTGDLITSNIVNGLKSTYEVLNIKDRRSSSLYGYDYITLETLWSLK